MNTFEMHQEKAGLVNVYQQKTHSALKDNYLANIVAQIPGYMYLKDSQKGTYLGSSGAIVQLLGFPDGQEIIGKTNKQVVDLIKHNGLLSFIKSLEHYEDLASTNNAQYKNILSEPFINNVGRIVQLDMSFSPLTNTKNQVQVVQFYAQDVVNQLSPPELLKLYEKHYADQKMAAFMFLEHIGFSNYINPNCSLTKREIDILILFSNGKTAKEIARSISISPRTAEKHLDKIKEKINVRNRIQLMRIFISCFSQQ